MPAAWPGVAGNSYYDLSDQSQLAAIVTEALAQEEDTGLLADFHLRYLRKTGYTSTLIAFTDTTLEEHHHAVYGGGVLTGRVGGAACCFVQLSAGRRGNAAGGRRWAQQVQFLSDASHELKNAADGDIVLSGSC